MKLRLSRNIIASENGVSTESSRESQILKLLSQAPRVNDESKTLACGDDQSEPTKRELLPPTSRCEGDGEEKSQSDTQRVVMFHDIAGGTTEVIIEHEGQKYRLRATRNGRLLLNK